MFNVSAVERRKEEILKDSLLHKYPKKGMQHQKDTFTHVLSKV
jgi:hypothetical protein